jgi:16S rRNA (uracil1498-N3)-methyltransferase
MTHRYFVDNPIAGENATLTGPEAHHLLHVMRAKPGDEVILFDGSGDEFPARVESLRRSEVDLAVLGRHTVDRELPCPLILGVTLPKGDRQRWLVEKAVELGVTRLIPLETTRSVAQPNAKAVERLRRAVIEASKQCGRNRLMEIALPLGWSDFLTATAGDSVRLVAHPTSELRRPRLSVPPTGPITLAVGPEGGLTDEEVGQAADRGWQLVTLGPRIQRIETAALALAALVAMSLDDQRTCQG